MRYILLFLLIVNWGTSFSQDVRSLKELQPATQYENIHVEKISEDSLQSVFVIWIKKRVAEHYHAEHTENIVVITGKAEMTLGDSTFTIQAGDHLTIPKGTRHAVTKVFGRKPLQVLSIQSPNFDGTDRIFTHQQEQ